MTKKRRKIIDNSVQLEIKTHVLSTPVIKGFLMMRNQDYYYCFLRKFETRML